MLLLEQYHSVLIEGRPSMNFPFFLDVAISLFDFGTRPDILSESWLKIYRWTYLNAHFRQRYFIGQFFPAVNIRIVRFFESSFKLMQLKCCEGCSISSKILVEIAKVGSFLGTKKQDLTYVFSSGEDFDHRIHHRKYFVKFEIFLNRKLSFRPFKSFHCYKNCGRRMTGRF